MGVGAQFVAAHVAIADSHNLCVAFDLKLHVVLDALHAASLGVHGRDAYVLQVHAVRCPLCVVGLHEQADALASGFEMMACPHLAVLVGNGFQTAFLVGNIWPTDLVAVLGIGGILATSQALAVESQLHLVAVGIDEQVGLRAVGTVPELRLAVGARDDAVPLHTLVLVLHDGDAYQRLVGEERLHEVCLGLRHEVDVEHALRPTLLRPALALAQVVDGSPVGQSDDAAEIHLKPVGSHGCRRSLALIELHPRKALAVAGEIHIAVVVGLDVGLHGQVTRQRVGLPVAVARVHGNGNQSGGVVTLQHGFHHLVACHAEVVERLVGILLQFVS